jgi:hypothetical protein
MRRTTNPIMNQPKIASSDMIRAPGFWILDGPDRLDMTDPHPSPVREDTPVPIHSFEARLVLEAD